MRVRRCPALQKYPSILIIPTGLNWKSSFSQRFPYVKEVLSYTKKPDMNPH